MLLLIVIFISYSLADSGILIQRACAINPDLSMCRPSNRIESKFGSLLRLPGGADEVETSDEELESADEKIEIEEEGNSTAIPLPVPESPENLTDTVSVFISEFCVNNRNRFVLKCHGAVDPSDVLFCKSYPSSCSTIGDVIPIMTYCARSYKKYRPLCSEETNPKVEQFCLAFEQFCLPTKKNVAGSAPTPSPVLQRCEDVVGEARKVCNPMPNKSDEFNYIRCSRFVEKCRKYVDWI